MRGLCRSSRITGQIFVLSVVSGSCVYDGARGPVAGFATSVRRAFGKHTWFSESVWRASFCCSESWSATAGDVSDRHSWFNARPMFRRKVKRPLSLQSRWNRRINAAHEQRKERLARDVYMVQSVAGSTKVRRRCCRWRSYLL